MFFALKCFVLLLLCNVLNRKQARTARISCVTVYDDLFVFDTSNTSNEEILYECSGGKNISLQGEGTFVVNGADDLALLSFISIDDVQMCTFIENITTEHIHCSILSIRGSCEGPKLVVVNSPHLVGLTMTPALFRSVATTRHAVRVRGNKMLNEESISLLREYANGTECLDVQELGECSLPRPFKSFQAMDKTCSSFYGPLTLEKGVKQILYNSSEIHNFKFEGCIQIESTELKDLTFLYAFSKFKPIPYCTQFIRNNKNLCLSNLNYLNGFFKNISFYNNSEEACGECLGGRVSERYLDESANCSFVYGDLIIANFRGVPSNIANLRGIESIQGRLIIKNNTGLNRFEHLHSLKKIGSQNGKEVAVIVKDNADLKILRMPSLSHMNLKDYEKRIELVNNPMLHLGDEQTVTELSTMEQTTAIFANTREANRKRTMQTSNGGGNGISKALLLGVMTALLLSSPCTLGNFFCVNVKKCERLSLRPQENSCLLFQKQSVSPCTRTKYILNR